MKPIATILIPYAPYHESIRFKAIQSAYSQSIKCDVICAPSPNSPAIVRNLGMKANTDFLVFLDSDDWLEYNFVEECLKAYETGKYVYTSWWCGQALQKPNLCVTADNDKDYHSHLVTTLYPTEVFKISHGFDATLHGHEDVDFYLRSAKNGICGIHLDKPLVHYTEHGQRSALFSADATDMKNTMDSIYLKNGGQRTIMGCCGGQGVQAKANPGEQQPGDVLATALWAGMRSEVGLATGRVYVGGNQGKLWVHPEDIKQAPHLFQAVPNFGDLAPKREKVLRESGLV